MSPHPTPSKPSPGPILGLRPQPFILVALLLFSSIATASPHWIIGGTDATPKEWPWMVAVVEAGGTAAETQFCGGTLVAPHWVLTAAHCVVDEDVLEVVALPASYFEVVLGLYDLEDESTAERLVVDEVILYGYDAYTADNDVALLHLKEASTYRPIEALITAETEPLYAAPGAMGTVKGWGALAADLSAYPTLLQEVQIPIVDRETCNAPSAFDGGLTETMLCAGWLEGGKDSCLGDSGGPFVVATEQGEVALAGVVSWGWGCAEPAAYGAYARVSRYVEWIAAERVAHGDLDPECWDLDADGICDPEEDQDGDGLCREEDDCGPVLPDLKVSVADLPPGDDCPEGGFMVAVGLDDDGDGQLDASEVREETTLCSEGGEILLSTAPAPVSPDCPGPGLRIAAGVDLDGDGVLDAGEETKQLVVCRPEDPGAPALLSETRQEAPGDLCADGGTVAIVGQDLDGDGQLSDEEILESSVACTEVKTSSGGGCAAGFPPTSRPPWAPILLSLSLALVLLPLRLRRRAWARPRAE